MGDKPTTSTGDLKTILDESGNWKLYATKTRVCAMSGNYSRLIRAYMTDDHWNPVEVDDNLTVETVVRRYVDVSDTDVSENELYEAAMEVILERFTE